MLGKDGASLEPPYMTVDACVARLHLHERWKKTSEQLYFREDRIHWTNLETDLKAALNFNMEFYWILRDMLSTQIDDQNYTRDQDLMPAVRTLSTIINKPDLYGNFREAYERRMRKRESRALQQLGLLG